eukprot:GEMP01039173.1.p1 GENE.GEMP01039173.1~~GEMP01039173.1.p1  ORF type:complete len:314 (+),score=73.25 GEMP01039173.1:344-1285(+)
MEETPVPRRLEDDAWALARVALGSFAGESWRFRQAFVEIQNDEEVADAEEHLQPYESYRKSQSYFDFLRNPQRPEEKWTGHVDIILFSPEKKIYDVLLMDKVVDHIAIFFGPGVTVTITEAPPHEQEALRKSSAEDGRGVAISGNQLLCLLRLRSRPPGTLAFGITLHALIPPECHSPVNALVHPKAMVGAFSLYRYVEKTQETRSPVQQTAYEPIVKGMCAAVCRVLGMTSCQLLKCLLNPDTLPYRIRNEEPPMHLCCICLRKLHFATQVDLLDRYALLQTMDFPEAMLATKRISSIGMPTYVCMSSRKAK